MHVFKYSLIELLKLNVPMYNNTTYYMNITVSIYTIKIK